LLLLIDYTPWGNTLFGTAPIGSNVWLYIIAFMPGALLIKELRKWVVRKMIRRKSSDNTGQ
jgi:sodium/potassium-transporting ATPase subunit alpha